jgi:hypothetical protein
MDRVYEMAAHLFLADAPFSRNRNFAAFTDPRFARAIAVYRRCRALLSDLERALVDGTQLRVVEEARAGRRSVRLELRGERYRRTCFLDKAVWDVLMLHSSARRAVTDLERRAGARAAERAG